MVEKYLIWPLRVFLYSAGLFLIIFYTAIGFLSLNDISSRVVNNIYGKSEHAKLQKRMKNRLDKLQKHYQDNSDISEKPDSWQTKMRSKK